MADLRSIPVDSVWTESLRVPNTARVSRTIGGFGGPEEEFRLVQVVRPAAKRLTAVQVSVIPIVGRWTAETRSDACFGRTDKHWATDRE
jgi:hypothetical protein